MLCKASAKKERISQLNHSQNIESSDWRAARNISPANVKSICFGCCCSAWKFRRVVGFLFCVCTHLFIQAFLILCVSQYVCERCCWPDRVSQINGNAINSSACLHDTMCAMCCGGHVRFCMRQKNEIDDRIVRSTNADNDGNGAYFLGQIGQSEDGKYM